jgi:hypothetical protein
MTDRRAEFIRSVVDAASPMTPEIAALLRRLLPPPTSTKKSRPTACLAAEVGRPLTTQEETQMFDTDVTAPKAVA